MEKANYEARRMIADDVSGSEAKVRLTVTRNKLYTVLIREYFQLVKESAGE